MATLYYFPDPNDRSPNEPCVIVSPTQILGLYNQESTEINKPTQITNKVSDWFKKEAVLYKRDSVEFIGNQCLLRVNIPFRLPTSTQ